MRILAVGSPTVPGHTLAWLRCVNLCSRWLWNPIGARPVRSSASHPAIDDRETPGSRCKGRKWCPKNQRERKRVERLLRCGRKLLSSVRTIDALGDHLESGAPAGANRAAKPTKLITDQPTFVLETSGPNVAHSSSNGTEAELARLGMVAVPKAVSRGAVTAIRTLMTLSAAARRGPQAWVSDQASHRNDEAVRSRGSRGHRPFEQVPEGPSFKSHCNACQAGRV